MATKSVTYCSNSKLSCSNCLPADVVVCVIPNDRFLASPCFPQEATFDTTLSTFNASLISVTKFGNSCSGTMYKYTFEYDDSILDDPEEPITTEDISGVFCRGCLTKYIDQKVGIEPYIRDNEDGTLTLVTPHGCEYTFVGELA